MTLKLHILWTDYCLWVLLAVTLLGLFRVIKNPVARKTLKRLGERPIHVVAMVVLVGYGLIGLLDSIHFKSFDSETNIEVVSLLDRLLYPMWTHPEKSYSKPFAMYGFTKETIRLDSGVYVRDYPRLQYAGIHLNSPEERGMDLLKKFLMGTVFALLIWGGSAAVMAVINRGHWTVAWRWGSITIGVFIWVWMQIYILMPDYHILGTSQIGEDVLYQALKSVRTGLVLGTVTTLMMLPFALVLGLTAGYFKGWIDDLIQYLYTTLSSIPGVLLISAAVLSLQVLMNRHEDWFQLVIDRSDIRLLALCLILGITSWTGLCRLLRGEALKLRNIEYVQAAKTMGVSSFGILWKHLLPNVVPIILISIALDFSGLVLAEAVLSYVGVGVDPNTYSWGMMINGARLEMARVPLVWWSLATAFVFMFVLVLAANIFADRLREILDPRSHIRV